MEAKDRLKIAREAARLSRKQVAARIGYSVSGYGALENGQNGISPEAADLVAPVVKTTPEWILFGRGDAPVARNDDGDEPERMTPRRMGYPRIGRVGAGGLGEYSDDYAMGAADEYIEPLPGMPLEAEIIVLDVDGDSMVPAVFDGDLAFFGPIRRDVDKLLNRRVMARTMDGRKFFKVLKRGSRTGVYTLRSLNPATPDIEDVQIAWVLPYRGSRPRYID